MKNLSQTAAAEIFAALECHLTRFVEASSNITDPDHRTRDFMQPEDYVIDRMDGFPNDVIFGVGRGVGYFEGVADGLGITVDELIQLAAEDQRRNGSAVARTLVEDLRAAAQALRKPKGR